jgi:cell division septation protein DedD
MAQGDHDEGSVSPESSRAASDFEGLPPLEPISPLMSPSPENIAVDSSDQPPYLLLNASSSAPQLHPALRGDFGLRDSHSSIFRSRSDREELDNTPPTSPTPTNWEARALSPSPRPLSPSIRPLRSLSLPVFDGFITDDPIWDPSSPRSPRLSYLSTPVTSPRTQPLPPPRECSPLPSNPPSQRPNTQLNKNAEPFRPRSQQVARPQSPPRRAMSSSGRDSDKHGITSWPAGWAALSASSSLSPDTPPKDVSNDDHSKTISSSILRSRTPNVSSEFVLCLLMAREILTHVESTNPSPRTSTSFICSTTVVPFHLIRLQFTYHNAHARSCDASYLSCLWW